MDSHKQSGRDTPLRLLFVCTGNSARSQIAEAVLSRKGAGRMETASAGSQPAPRVHPLTVDVLREFGIDWSQRAPKGFDAVSDQQWDLIITVCDQAREACPTFPGQPAFAHWGMSDPAAVVGPDETRRQAFRDTVHYLSRRIDLLLALPVEKLERLALEQQARAIANQAPVPASPIGANLSQVGHT
jgi:arsenate reductase